MLALAIGIISGVIVVSIAGYAFVEIYDTCYSKTVEKIVLIAGTIVCLVALIGIPAAFVNYDIHCYKRWTNEYKIQKETIENSMRSEKIGGLERVELVKMVQELNKELAKKQYRCQQWYGFTGDKEVMNLEPIKFE